jgi:O-antigen/teichoic acid export membrane protein
METRAAERPKRSIGDSVSRGALALLGTQPITWGSSLLTAAVLPHFLGAQALGELTIVLTIVSLATVALGLGIPDFLVRETARRPELLRRGMGTALVVSSVTAVAGVVAIAVSAPMFTTSIGDARLLYVVLIGLLTAPPQNMLIAALKGREQHAGYAWFNALVAVLGQLLGAAALFAGADVLTYAVIATGSSAAATFIGWRLSGLRPALPRFDRLLLREAAWFTKGGFAFLTWNLTVTLMNGVDRLVLGAFVPSAEVGWYAAAARIFAMPIFIPTLVITPLFPALSRSYDEPDAIRIAMAKTLRLVSLLMVPTTVAIVVAAPFIPQLLSWPSDFDHSVPLIQLLSLQLPIMSFDMVLGSLLMASGRQGRWVVVGILATVFKVAANVVVIPTFEHLTGNGAIGASLVTFLTELVMLIGAIALTPKSLLEISTATSSGKIAAAGVAALLVGMAVAALDVMPPLVAVTASACTVFLTFGALSMVLRVATKDDILPLVARVLCRAR